MKKFLLYATRWQLSTPILAVCIAFLPFSTLWETIIANLIGASIFFWVDKIIFKSKNPHLNIWHDGSMPPPLGSSRPKEL